MRVEQAVEVSSRPGPAGEVDRRSVLGKVQLILDVLGESGQLGLSEISRRTGVAKATVHRLCRDLIAWGVVERSGDSFRLGPRLFELGQRVPTRRRLCDAALPFMEDVYVTTLQTVHLAVIEGTDVLYAVKLRGRQSVAVPSEVGSRLPLHCTATGKCLLAFGPAELLERAVESGLRPLTPRSVASPAELAVELDAVRSCGYAVEREQVHLGFASVAVPVFGARGEVVAALAVTSAIGEMSLERWLPPLKAATSELSRRLGARLDPPLQRDPAGRRPARSSVRC